VWFETTTATKITAIRLLLIPFIVFFYVGGVEFYRSDFFADWGRFVALIFFLLAIATDYLDGQIARRFNQISKRGAWLDTLADKLLVLTGLVLVFTDPQLVHDETISIIPVFAAVLLGIAIIGSDVAAAAKRTDIKTGMLEKAKVALQFTAIGLFMLFSVNYDMNNELFSVGTGESILAYLSWSALIVAAVLSVINVVYLEILYFKERSGVAEGTEQTQDGGKGEEGKNDDVKAVK